MYALGIVGESYTPLMAKRFNISIPDALAERLEPHKDRISLSAVMQAALERELAQLNLSDEDKQRRASLKAVAAGAWLRRNPFIGKTVSSFVEHLLDAAINDNADALFLYYRELSILCRKKEMIKKVASDTRYFFFLYGRTQEERERMAGDALDLAFDLAADEGFGTFTEALKQFLVEKIKRKEIHVPRHLLGCDVDEIAGEPEDWSPLTEELCAVINSRATLEIALRIMDEQLQNQVDEEVINNFVLDFESAFAELEGQLVQDGEGR